MRVIFDVWSSYAYHMREEQCRFGISCVARVK